ncbi:PEP-CTERM sorting domain-containing protein [Cerasicoccus arenae]|uniref:PEP-CTERM sorting domain-containing protein n=1 Tax=Cerasicoccus arenae TaxID=424488 RepID=A0A8J3GCR1_9BACT|nr:PEP-CTERM sorting domain-containing protein [Cerasicoccus arenae]MBK1858848.1 PEP-CTERM sorting domain-containing protein [Cerasicoccus arenae]GHB96021.1 hypothetical protein GCM10007047_09680 [Cerasicoccus arenae]
MKNPILKSNSAIAALASILLVSLSAHAAVVTWDNGSTDGDWDTPENWDPTGIPAANDKVIINNGDSVSKTGSVFFNDIIGTSDDGLSLTNGTLTISGDFTSFTGGGSSSSVNSQIGVDGGATTATLNIDGTLNIGNTNNTSSSSASMSIFGGSLVSTNIFQGRLSPSTSGHATGGWTINVLGGSLSAATFDWANTTNLDPDPIGRVIIGSTGTAVGGTLSVTEMSDDWTDRAGQYVLFNDALGSLTFGKTNYSNIADVQNLITNDFIRKDGSILDDFGITDNGSTWTVSIIPEPSTYAMLLGALVLPILFLRRKR